MFGKKFKSFKQRRNLYFFLKKIDDSFKFPSKGFNNVDDEVVALKYIIVSKLKEKVLDLERAFYEKKNKGDHSGINYVGHKIKKLLPKIRLFEIDFSKEEFKKIYGLIFNIEKELKDV